MPPYKDQGPYTESIAKAIRIYDHARYAGRSGCVVDLTTAMLRPNDTFTNEGCADEKRIPCRTTSFTAYSDMIDAMARYLDQLPTYGGRATYVHAALVDDYVIMLEVRPAEELSFS